MSRARVPVSLARLLPWKLSIRESRGHGQLKGQAEEKTDDFLSQGDVVHVPNHGERLNIIHQKKLKSGEKYRDRDRDHQHLVGRERHLSARRHHANAARVHSRDLHHGIDRNGASPQRKRMCLHMFRILLRRVLQGRQHPATNQKVSLQCL